MNRIWPWEVKRLGPHHFQVRPWRPHEDRRVRTVVVSLAGSAAAVGVWHLQAESGTAAHGSAAGLAAGVMVWGWRAWRR